MLQYNMYTNRKPGDEMQLKEIGNLISCHIQNDTIHDPSTVITGIGDDCAVYSATDETDQLISTDTMVEGFTLAFTI